jgi:hypothetical protein
MHSERLASFDPSQAELLDEGGEAQIYALVAAAHLVTPRITPTITADDQAIAFAWLRERDLFKYFEHGLPWLAAYWTFASDDAGLYEWCCSILT